MWVVKIDLVSVLGIELDVTSFSVGMKLIGLLCGWSILTRFQCRGGIDLGFCVAVENELFLVSGSKLTWFLCKDIEIDLILE